MINMLKLLEGRQPLKARRRWLKDGLFIVLLMVATVVVYWPAMHGRFVWDDNEHIYDNQTLRSLHGLWEIWFKPGATCQYYPLSFTGFWIGFQLWGLNPLGYHLLNVVLHGLVAVLLWQVLTRLKVRGAWLAGAIFALHPVCVMSVAWMTELKNTLSASLALGAAWAYLRFAHLGVYEAGTDEGRFLLCVPAHRLVIAIHGQTGGFTPCPWGCFNWGSSPRRRSVFCRCHCSW